jgi:hypothetical protein
VAIGAFFAATGPFGLSVTGSLATWLRIGGYVAGYIGSVIDAPKRLQQFQQYHMSLEPGTPLPVVYGRAKLGGIVADWIVDSLNNDKFKILYMVVPICHGSRDGSGIATVEQIWVNGNLGVTTSGDVRANYFTTEMLDYTIELGTDSQNVGAAQLTGLSPFLADKAMKDITDSGWSATTDTGKGIACVLFRMLNRPRKGQSDVMTFNGPPSFAFVVTGNKIYDTRTSTWISAGDNPAMCLRDYLLSPIYGCGYDVSLIHEQSFKDAADYCDTALTYLVIWAASTISTSSVANPTVITTTTNHNLQTGDGVKIAGHTGSTPAINGLWTVTRTGNTTFTIPVNVTVGGTGGTVTKVQALAHRFTCNGVIDTSRPTSENIDALKSACRGNLVWEQGQFKLSIRNGSPPAATVALSPSNIIGQWSFRNAGLEDKWNVVKATYINPMNGEFKSQETQWPPVGVSNAYLTADNSFTNTLAINLPFTNNQLMAQDICQVLLNERRLGITAQVRCNEEVLAASVGDLVTVTHPTPGWNVKPFWVTSLDAMPDGTVGVGLQEFDTTAYDPDTLEDLRTFPATTLPTNPPEIIPVVTDYIVEGDFEASLRGWATEGTVESGSLKATLETGANRYKGAASLRMHTGAATAVSMYQSGSTQYAGGVVRVVRIEAGTILNASGWFRWEATPSHAGSIGYLAVDWLDDSFAFVSADFALTWAIGVGTTWSHATGTVTAPAGTYYAAISVELVRDTLDTDPAGLFDELHLKE